MNSTAFVGNLVADPVLRTSQQGKNRATFTVAVSEGERGTENEKTHFIDVTAFGGIGENVVTSLKKGMNVLVYGRFDQYEQEFKRVDNDETIKVKRLSFIASAVGPNLRWQTANVAKAQTNAGGGYQAAPAAAPAQAAAPVAAPVAAPAPVAAGADDF